MTKREAMKEMEKFTFLDESKKEKLAFLKMQIDNELKKQWRKFVTTSEVIEVILKIIIENEFQLNDFNIFVNEENVEIQFRNREFLNLKYYQNPASRIISFR